jgi:uncharacterized protein involved in response to NO
MPEPAARPRFALFAKGFRPFFLLAALYACAIVPIWIFIVSGALPPSTYVDAWSWHAHEMIFGYTTAVIAGFLLTAVGNWTKRETAVGAPLLGLAALWVLGRVAMAVAGSLPRGVAAIADLAFLPALFVALARPLVATRDRRNFVMLAVVAVLFVMNLAIHLDALGLLPLGSAHRASLTAVDVVIFLIVVMAGRVIPMFTRNATGVATIRSIPALDGAAAASAALLVVVDAVLPDSTLARVASATTGALVLARAARWGVQHTFRQPLLWILHVGHAWIIVGLFLRALPVWSSLATHALTAGAIGALTLGMMARVALGHTGRSLVAPRTAAWAFASMTAAAIARVAVPLVVMRWHFVALEIAATFWSLAFVLFLIGYAPILTRPRIDGKAG